MIYIIMSTYTPKRGHAVSALFKMENLKMYFESRSTSRRVGRGIIISFGSLLLIFW
jgi:hypothetical protein